MTAEIIQTDESVRKKIVFVDDVKFHLLSTKDRLKKHYKVYIAQSAEILFDILANIQPDLILLDINMPETDGYQAIKQIKSTPELADIPVVFLSAQYDIDSIEKAMKLGAVDFIGKPYTDTELIKCIEYHINPHNRDIEDKPIILAVDDNPAMLKSLHSVLKDCYKVYTLTEPENLKQLLQKIPAPDMFLLDIEMPVTGGFDLIKTIRGYSIHKDTPVIIMTSTGTVDNIAMAASCGACDFIIKPIDDAVLNEKLELHLNNVMMLRRIRTLHLASYEK